MTRHQQVVVALSVMILHEAVRTAHLGPATTNAVRLALRCLLPFVRDKERLSGFWVTAGSPDPARAQSMIANLQNIRMDLEIGGVLPRDQGGSLADAVYIREIRSTKGAPKSVRGRAVMREHLAAGREPDGAVRG